MVGDWSNLCTADLHDGVGLVTCEDFVWPDDRTVRLSVDQVVGGHREMVEVERGVVVEVRNVEDPAMTKCELHMMHEKEQIICFTLSLGLNLDQHARKYCVCKVYTVRCAVSTSEMAMDRS